MFCPSGVARQPVGGYKMAYEYANRLVKENHDVSILYLNQDFLKKYRMPSYLKRIGANLITKIEPKWFFLIKE